MRFVAIDVETANRNYHSICQIGVVLFEDGREVAAEVVLVDPREEFEPFHMRLHGITPRHVAGSRCFAEHHDWLSHWLEGQTVVSHTGFDRAAFAQACALHSLPGWSCQWIDSEAIARETWPGLTNYKLRHLATCLGHDYRAHDALEDARACGRIILHAMNGGSLEDSGQTLAKEMRSRFAGPVKREGDGTGGLAGEIVVFTGDLAVPRDTAAAMAAKAGANVLDNPRKDMTLLVVGERDLQPGWTLKSGKHVRTEGLIAKGRPIRIISEREFLERAAIED